MIDCGLDACLIKVAALGLTTRDLGHTIKELQPKFRKNQKEFGFNPCGEGGEYESFTLDCPLFHSKIVLDETQTVIHSEDEYAPVAFLKLNRFHCEPKPEPAIDLTSAAVLQAPFSIAAPVSSTQGHKSTAFRLTALPTDRRLYVRVVADVSDVDPILLLAQLEELFASNSFSAADIQFAYFWLQDMSNFNSLNSLYASFIPMSRPPARATVGRSQDAAFELELFAEKEVWSARTQIILYVQSISKWAPACIGPYSQCRFVNSLIYFAGMIGMVPETMNLDSDNTETQLRRAISNLDAIFPVVGTSAASVFAVVVFLLDLSEVSAVSNIVSSWLTDLSGLQVVFLQAASLPKGARVEVVLTAMESSQSFEVQTTESDQGITTTVSFAPTKQCPGGSYWRVGTLASTPPEDVPGLPQGWREKASFIRERRDGLHRFRSLAEFFL